MPASDEFAPPRSGEMSEQVGGAQLEVVAAGDVYPADESSPHADLVAGACRIQEARDDAFGSGADTAESAEESQSADRALVGQQQP